MRHENILGLGAWGLGGSLGGSLGGAILAPVVQKEGGGGSLIQPPAPRPHRRLKNDVLCLGVLDFGAVLGRSWGPRSFQVGPRGLRKFQKRPPRGLPRGLVAQSSIHCSLFIVH